MFQEKYKADFSSYMQTVHFTLTDQHVNDDTVNNTNKLMYWLKWYRVQTDVAFLRSLEVLNWVNFVTLAVEWGSSALIDDPNTKASLCSTHTIITHCLRYTKWNVIRVMIIHNHSMYGGEFAAVTRNKMSYRWPADPGCELTDSSFPK